MCGIFGSGFFKKKSTTTKFYVKSLKQSKNSFVWNLLHKFIFFVSQIVCKLGKKYMVCKKTQQKSFVKKSGNIKEDSFETIPRKKRPLQYYEAFFASFSWVMKHTDISRTAAHFCKIRLFVIGLMHTFFKNIFFLFHYMYSFVS